MAEDLEAVGVRPKPRKAHISAATAHVRAVSKHLREHGVVPRPQWQTGQGVFVFGYLPHTARIEVIVRDARVRVAVVSRVREVLALGDYQTSTVQYVGKIVINATKDAPNTRVPRARKREGA